MANADNTTIVDETITLDDSSGTFRVMLTAHIIGKKFTAIRDSLYATRNLSGDDEDLSVAHPDVIPLLPILKVAAKAIEVVKNTRAQYRAQATDEALKLAMLGDSIFIVSIDRGMPVIKPKFPVDIPEDAFNDDAENVERLGYGAPMLPKRNPNHPIEQRVVIMRALFNQYPAASQRLATAFSRAIEQIVDAQMREVVAETDEDGFHTGTVDGNLDVSTSADGQAGKTSDDHREAVRAGDDLAEVGTGSLPGEADGLSGDRGSA